MPDGELQMTKPILIAGVGNLIQQDDGFGVHVVRELEKRAIPENTEIFDGGTLGIDLLPYLVNREYVIIIDTIAADHPAGTIFRFEPNDINYDDAPKTSIHQLGLIDSLKMLALTSQEPQKVIIFAVQPKIIDWGESLSPELEEIVPKVADLVVKELSKIINEKSNILEA